MELTEKITKNWFTRRPQAFAFDFTLFLVALLCLGSFSYLTGFAGGDSWMPARGDAVFGRHEYWRAWTTLFAHGDLGHLLSNLFLFIPFSYFLLGHFSRLFFPVAGFLAGGLANLVVLRTMPPQVQLVGVSGVVYWMGAAWLTLYLLIDRIETMKRRIAKVVVLTLVLFVPEVYRPQTSYLSHFLGFAFGIASALIFYRFTRKKILAAEVREQIFHAPIDWEAKEEDPLNASREA